MPRKGQARKRADLESADTNSATVEATRDELGEQYQEYVETHGEAINTTSNRTILLIALVFVASFIVLFGILLYMLMMY